MTTGPEWQDQVGRNWAASWLRTDRSFFELTAHFLARLDSAPGAAILDVGCGAGELSLALAAARPGARVLGVDISEDLILAARERAGADGPAFAIADAASFLPPFAPDLLVSRHGVMFFDRPGRAFAHLRAVAAPAATLAFTCFRDMALNRWATGLAAILAEEAPPAFVAPADPANPPPGPFAFADPLRVEAILSAAGWHDICFEPVDFSYVAGEGDDPVADAMTFFSRIGAAAPALRATEGPARMRLVGRISEWLELHRQGDRVRFAAAAWLVSATRE